MIEIKNLHKSFAKLKVLNGATLNVLDGEIHTIIGKSGTGKSVLIKTIIGLICPDKGEVIIDGNLICAYSEKQLNEKIRPFVSFVFQEGALWDSLTIGQNIDLALGIRKQLSHDERKTCIVESLDLVGLGDIKDKYPEQLSGGMLKRVAIARAIATRPKYLLYDEPTTGLDPVLSNVINSLIKKLNDELGITSLIISHDIAGTEKISDRVSMLYEGKIILTCDTKDIWKQENKIFNDFITGKVNNND